jgi:hypothetical protein
MCDKCGFDGNEAIRIIVSKQKSIFKFAKALLKYGKCLSSCLSEKSFDAPCNCGFNEIQEEAGKI